MIAFDETDEARLLSAFVPFVLLRRPRLLADICTAEVGDSVGTTKPFWLPSLQRDKLLFIGLMCWLYLELP